MEDTGKRAYRGRGNYRRRAGEAKAEFPEMPFPAEARVTPKHLGFLHVHLGLSTSEIVSRYPNRLTPALVHLGLYHYFSNRETLDEELKAETKFNLAASLKETSMSLPRVGLGSLVEVEDAFKAVSDADRIRGEKERWKPTFRLKEPPDS